MTTTTTTTAGVVKRNGRRFGRHRITHLGMRRWVRHQFRRRQHPNWCKHCRRAHPHPCPSPDEIRRRCWEVQEAWDEHWRIKRAGKTAWYSAKFREWLAVEDMWTAPLFVPPDQHEMEDGDN